MPASQPLSRGLTLGKYAPFHCGHQLVIETALREVDELVVVVYDSPAVTAVPLPVRAGWIRQLYPQVRVVEGWNAPAAVGDTPEIKRLQEDYIIQQLGIAGITHFYSSEFYGAHMSTALGAVDRRVDPARAQAPISATAIRADPYAGRAYLHPLVYRDLITNVVFLGAPSTGKSTIAERLAEHFATVWMPEYGREYWERHQIGRRLAPEQLVEIAEGHLEREEQLLGEANRYLFTDTNATTTYQFALAYHGAADPRLAALADRCASRYDLVFLCDTDIPYSDTWDRSGEVDRQIFQRRVLADLHMRKQPFFLLRGDVATRIRSVAAILERHHKYANLLESYPPSTSEAQ
jgi:HTH-type transcriptional regulator, transcriptional repressor of NAD biosynthesis genes